MGPLTSDMEDEDGTCLLDVLCDPQALNDFLHGTSELQTEDLLINSSSGEPSLFTDAPSPVSLLGDGRDCPDTPPPGCVDLSFLEEALLSSPEGGEDSEAVQPPVEAGCEAKAEGVGEAEVACDILQQSLQEAEITEQTMALEAGLAQTGDGLSLYSPAPLLSPPTVPFIPKSVTLPVATTLPRDTQAAVEPPQPSLLAVGPGCPSLKPAAPAQLMGLLPGNVFPAPSPDNSFSLSPAQGSSMIIHKAVPSVTTRPLLNPPLRAAAAPAPSIVLQRAPLPIQPKLPISIQPRLVQISPKPSGQKATSGLTFVPATASPNMLLSQAPGQKTVAPQPQAAQQLSKPVSLQLVNQGGSFVLQPQGLFQGQNQFLLPGQCPVTISQPVRAVQPLLTPSHQGPSVHSVAASTGQLVDGSQILTVPQRQLNFSPVFTTPTGQLALRQATVLSGSLQLQSAPATVFQMPAQLAGAYTAGGQGQQATLVHSPALGNHITLINSSGVLPQDLTSISIVNGPSVVQGLPFAAQAAAPQAGLTEGQLSLQRASVVLLPERPVQEERSISEEAFQQLQQPFGHVVQHVSVQSNSAGLQSSPPPVVAVLQPHPEPPLAPEAAVEMPKLLMPTADLKHMVEEVTHSMSQSQAFMQHMPQQEALGSPIPSELLVAALPAVPIDPLASPVGSDRENQPQPGAASEPDPNVVSAERGELSPHPSDPGDTALPCSPSLVQEAVRPASVTFSPPAGPQTSASQPLMEAQVQYQAPHQHQVPQNLFAEAQANVPPSAPQPQSTNATPAHSSPSPLHVSISVPQQQTAHLSKEGDESAVQQHTQNKPTAALESETFTLNVHPPSPADQGAGVPRHPVQCGPFQGSQKTSQKLAGNLELQREERLTPAMRRHRFQQQLCLDHGAVQNPITRPAFTSLKDAVRCLLPYHTCAGHLPTQDDFNTVDQEFDTVSGFLLKRTKDMVNKYRQLLVKETQQESPSAEMVMLERLFLQAERYALAEERRRARKDPETFMTVLATSASSPHSAQSSGLSHVHSSSSPSSPPAWARLTERPPGLKTYRSSSRGALRLTIKQESGSRKVIHNSACDPGLKRDHTGQLTNGGGSVNERHLQATNGATRRHQYGEEMSDGVLSCNTGEQVQQTAAESQTKPPIPLPMTEPEDVCFEIATRDIGAPKLKCYRLDVSPQPEQHLSPASLPFQEDNILSEHLQSAIDSILELQRLQGPSTAPSRGASGPSLDQPVTSILEGHL
ncbi:PREDICTED: glioma tumor suppressor candidate region gene 1 protein-like isoform X1 [Cyprinodon variegatus]|uniref:glioma tumor suppressor candidate region gene 1 protein-like isoform X1 n=2 Tax=Cyprinodon variegatus TaxID=28743 RepID=UPI000742664B|nr:PREDICTED: glioma tumor suppressor candidate region gene 1 protein-like isoform X1 [Cyprinodon variegatus]XP_015253005.1 PREDICTED: glioma tumor suppressor candidate region gene 1 protein-like isoform X1 [Cyprinodon variegatus]XP_015253006.1 PREDICTED: glioma tumor suppressor candidate region gene 1 protein-like isoform X1 [Cyprinodon variegatus]